MHGEPRRGDGAYQTLLLTYATIMKGKKPTTNSRPSVDSLDAHEERKGLLSGKDELGHKDDDELEEDLSKHSWSRRKVILVSSLLIVLLLSGALMQHVVIRNKVYTKHPNLSFNGEYIRSNGTHDFKRTVLIVSIDGLR